MSHFPFPVMDHDGACEAQAFLPLDGVWPYLTGSVRFGTRCGLSAPCLYG